MQTSDFTVACVTYCYFCYFVTFECHGCFTYRTYYNMSVINHHPNSDKGNLIITYVTLDSKFSVTAILFTEVSQFTFTVYKYTF